MKIKEIRLSSASPTVKYCLPDYYDFLVDEFQKAYSVHLPHRQYMSFDKKTTWRALCEPYKIWVIWEDSSIWEYSFERGFLTDLASVPSNLRSIIDNDNPCIIIGALIHDGYYQTKGAFDCITSGQGKKEADDLLRETCLYYGMAKPYAWAVHESVDKFGHKAWNTFADKDKERRFSIRKFPANNVEVQK